MAFTGLQMCITIIAEIKSSHGGTTNCSSGPFKSECFRNQTEFSLGNMCRRATVQKKKREYRAAS